MPDMVAAQAIIRAHVGVDPQSPEDEGTNTTTTITTTANWKNLPDLPASEELLANPSTDELPWFPIENNWASKEEYLTSLYSILRFEGIEGLRYSVKSARASPNMTDDDNTCVYTKVRIQGYLFARLGPIARISFSTKRAGAMVKWKQSKRLLAGKIVALSNDYFKTDCRVAVIAQRPIEGGLDQNPPLVDIIWANPTQAHIDPSQELVMVESRNGYYEAVRHALKGLQHAASEWSTLDKYIIDLDRSDAPYPTTSDQIDYSSVVDHLDPKQLCPGNKKAEQQAFRDTEDRFKEMSRKSKQNIEALKPHSSLDDSQLQALERMVTKELAIVQGPPGTGKTFTSVKSIAAILKNRQPGDPPIIVSAQTNHALDQLLIYCKSAGANIMRVGGRTDNDEIAQRTMYELRKAAKLGGQNQNLESQRTRTINEFEVLIEGVFGGEGLIDPLKLMEAGVITEAQYNSFDDEWETDENVPAMDRWLGAEKIKRAHQEMDEQFENFEPEDEIELDLNLNDDQIEDDDDRIYGKWISLSSRYTGRKPLIPSWERRCREQLERKDDVFDIAPAYRGGVYQVMEMKLREATAAKFRGLLAQSAKQAKETKIHNWTRDLSIIDRHCIDIVGCTTTGLTKYRGYLAAFLPRVLLIEEAAETREANVASALFPSLKQLILVGDHQQLPPSCDIARLATHPWNLNVSLFERLVENNLPYTMLNRQRRMAPELRYIVQKFYPKLQDHPLVTDVSKRPLIPGLGDRRSFFFTHQWPEDTDADNSKFNQAEVEMVVAFIRYLLLNNVKASEITVLTYYRGQKRKLLQRLRQKDIPIGNFFNVATVDSYQGEENEIVILSLVRSPSPGRAFQVGFLESQNRATVAISRARRGFFMFGNKENILQASNQSFQTWAPIWNAFAEQKRVAMNKGLPLVCQNHGKEIWLKDSDGLVDNAGGCWLKCNGKLNCGHACVLKCHNIPHDKLPCLQPCPKTLTCSHKCAGYCSDPCRCSINCPKFVSTRLLEQLAKVKTGPRIKPDAADTLLSSPESLTVVEPTKTPSPADWQELANNPEAHDEAIRAANRKLMGDEDQVNATLRKAFENIQEDFIEVTEKDGRRIQGVSKHVDVREENRLRKQMTGNAGLNGARSNASGQGRQLPGQRPSQAQRENIGAPRNGDVTRARQPGGIGSGQWGNGQARSMPTKAPAANTTQASRLNGRASNTRFGTQAGRSGSQARRGGNRSGLRGDKSYGVARPAPINTQTANANAVSNRARPNGHTGTRNYNNGFQTVQNGPHLHDDKAVAAKSPTSPQDAVPDSASIVGDMGFEDELQQATQRELYMANQARQRLPQPPVLRSQPVQTELLIDFGDDGLASASGSQDTKKDKDNQGMYEEPVLILL